MYKKEKDNYLENEANWYIIQTYSGCENSVKKKILQLIESANVSDFIFEVISPKETYLEIKDGKRKEKERQIYSGYVFIKMIMNDRTWYLIRNIPRVTGFLGATKEKRNLKPVPLNENEIKPILLRIGAISKTDFTYLKEQKVEIISGSFVGKIGKVLHIDNQQEKITIEIDLFGRATPIEITFSDFKEI